MINFGLILTSFGIVLIAELGDKTQLAAFSLTTTTRRPALVFAATSSALVLSSLAASLLGKAASEFIPNFINYVSAGLFIVFGIYIVFSKEPSNVKEAFLNSIAVEKSCIELVKKLRSAEFCDGGELAAVCGEEESHYQTFRLLLKEKNLFRTSINEHPELAEVLERMKPCSSSKGQSHGEILNQLIDRERASIAFFRVLLDHIDEFHQRSDETEHALRRMIAEERGHERMFTEMRNKLDERNT